MRNTLLATFLLLSSFMSSPAPTTAAEQEPQFKAGDRAIVVPESAELKVGDEVVTKVTKGQLLNVTHIQNEWVGCTLQVDKQKKFGWIAARFLAASPPVARETPRRDDQSPKEKKPTPAQATPVKGEGWKVATYGMALFVTLKTGKVMVMGLDPPPLEISLEINGKYPGLPALKIDSDFSFYTRSGGLVSAHSVPLPKEVLTTIVGDANKSIKVDIVLCETYNVGFGLGEMVKKGYAAKDILISYKGGKKVPLIDLRKGAP